MTWAVGDLAVCVDARPNRAFPARRVLVEGRVYHVAGFAPVSGGLLIDGPPAQYQALGYGWRHDRFRKILPDKHEACDPEFIEVHIKKRVSA